VQIIFEGDDISETLELEATTVSRIGNCPGSGPFEAGSTVNFEASGYDDYGNQMPVTAAWSLTGDVATLAENGNVRMNRPAKPSRYRSLSVSLRGLRRGSN
jgi:hypothetical protein